MSWLIGPVLIGVAVNQINTMVDRTLASTLVEGSISALNYANKLNGFVMAMFITSVAAVIYPMLSKLSSEDNKEKFLYLLYRHGKFQKRLYGSKKAVQYKVLALQRGLFYSQQ